MTLEHPIYSLQYAPVLSPGIMTVPTIINAYLCAVMLQEIAALSLIMASFPHWIALSVTSESILARLVSAHRRAAHLLAFAFFLQAYSTPDLRGTTLDPRDPRVVFQFHIANRLFFSGFTLLLAYLGTRVEAAKFCEMYLAKKRMLDAIHVSETEKYDMSTKTIEQDLVDADRHVKAEQLMQALDQDDGEDGSAMVRQVLCTATTTSKMQQEDEEVVSEYEFGQDAETAVVD
ncbi:hypothetical protein BCR44DRAFT_1425343 [Catenaria anguillulae PL171]|uniref:Uncharacterized protein n=1 Tax=Catenaria anguillulae PL171 TaxID=765915 RepID=A0A1Y2I3R7_9FUNG|nr:hypothetical protein BCR44DRAFT_1425343 [Catenaria anguillulae PL171]